MFQATFRLRRKTAVCCVAAVGILVFGAGFGLLFLQQPDLCRADAAGDAAEVSAAETHAAFLRACGWHVSSAPSSVAVVKIPSVFGAVYERYNRLQRAQGFDLSAYRGKTVKKYVYEILGYPGAADGFVFANVLDYNGVVIGGDISSVRIDGFMHGFHGETDGYDQTG